MRERLTPAEIEARWFREFFGTLRDNLAILGGVFLIGVLPFVPAAIEAIVKVENAQAL